jgi:hypothetical protein
MATDPMAHPGRISLARSAVFRAARLLAFGLLGWVSLSLAGDPSLKAVSLIAVLGVAATVSVTWYLSRARAERRRRAAWDRYAEQEPAKPTNPRRDPHGRPRLPIR